MAGYRLFALLALLCLAIFAAADSNVNLNKSLGARSDAVDTPDHHKFVKRSAERDLAEANAELARLRNRIREEGAAITANQREIYNRQVDVAALERRPDANVYKSRIRQLKNEIKTLQKSIERSESDIARYERQRVPQVSKAGRAQEEIRRRRGGRH